LAYIVDYSPEAETHLRQFTARQQRTVIDTVDRQLLNQPNVETRNKKPMRPNPVAPFRIGNFRVYYEISEEPEATVTILAIGVKERNRVRIGGEIIKL